MVTVPTTPAPVMVSPMEINPVTAESVMLVPDEVAVATAPMAAVAVALVGPAIPIAFAMICAAPEKLVAAERLMEALLRATPSIVTFSAPDIACSCARVSAETLAPRR